MPSLEPLLQRFALLMLAAACVPAPRAAAASDDGRKTREMVAVLQSDAPLFDKARACQQLGEFGGPEAVPALAELLVDEHLSAYARSGLEGIPGPAAASALRAAAARLEGDRLAGVVNSLGVLRDAQSVSLLRKLTDDPAAGVVEEALLALGRIATSDSIALLRAALTQEAANRRAAAAAGCLLAAEQELASGDRNAAVALYDAVRTANPPWMYRTAATLGAIVARNEAGVPLLIEQLNSPDRRFREVALLAIRRMPSDTLANALNDALDPAPVSLQVQLLIAFVDCHNAESLQILRTAASGADAEVRQTALQVLGQIGAPSDAGVLLRAVTAPVSAVESEIALNSLRRMEGAEIDTQIVGALTSTPDAESRIQLMRLLDDRAAANAAAALLEQASSSNVEVAIAALRALKSLAEFGDLPALIALSRAARSDALRRAGENAVAGVCLRTGQVARGSEAVLAELGQTTDPTRKTSWIRLLVALGDAQALPAVLGALHDTDQLVVLATIEELARWPDPAPIDALITMVRDDANPVQRERALDSVIRLATAAADEHQRPAETVLAWFNQASQAARSIEQRRLILSGLGRVPDVESLRLLAPYLEDPALRTEAAAAVIQISPAVLEQAPASAVLRSALDRIVATADNADLRAKARSIRTSIPN